MIGVYRRYIVVWGISNSLEASELLKIVQEAISIHSKPEILNSVKDTQFHVKVM
ncbi:hypothetical protein [Kaistella flava (ex Peng et al. 2021)]|uniref:hypothetical protein n=1 Tax=Kaistella flava (ex Peng et al. 2021) TaxID=2038776 RepID=UPI00187E7878|nr:hypothetical protein [Kaistella flava (ex Peng et al. 2021)]